MRDKEESYSKQKGGKYMKRDDFRQYAANLRVKNANFKVMKKVLDEIKAEVVVLKRTEQILKQRTDNVDAVMKDLE
jgi:intraflagellar transport protein 81